MHHYRIVLGHDGRRVTEVRGESVRVPWTTCHDSGPLLDRLVGVPLTSRPIDVAGWTDPRQQCTHWFDLAVLAILHAAAGRARRQFDLEVPDWLDESFEAWLDIDGRRRLHWAIGPDFAITDPDPYVGRPLRGGFSRWAEATLDDDEVEAAFVLHRGTWLSAARRFDLEATENAIEGMLAPGACYTGQPAVIGVALRERGSLRDYGASADPLLTTPGDPT